MTKTTTYLLGIFITLILGTYFFMILCSDCIAPQKSLIIKETALPTVLDATSYPFAFHDGDFDYNVKDNFNFNLSSASILPPVSQKVIDGITGLKIFLDNNTGKIITITGLYKSDETNSTAFPNLGLARATAVKNYLVSSGISSVQVNTLSTLSDEMVPKTNFLLGATTYSISGENPDSAAEELNALYEKIKAEPLVLYFETGQSTIDLTAEQRQKVAAISRYLDKVEDATCNVVGHTDNTGTKDTNSRLGQERAEFAKAYLVKNGIPELKIKTSSQGQDVPIESNATDEGKAKNRRTVVTLN